MNRPAAPPELSDEEWDRWAVDTGQLFGTREWLQTWRRHEQPGAVVQLVCRRSDGSLAGMLWLSVIRRFPTVLRPLGPWPAPAASVLCAEEDRPWVTRNLLAQLQATPGWDVALLDVDAPLPPLRRGVIETSPVSSYRIVDLSGRTWDEVLAGSSKNSRHAYKRRLRRLHEQHTVEFRRTTSPDRLTDDLDVFLRLHWNRWGDRTFLLTPERRPFLQDFAATALNQDRLSLWFLDLDGQPAAAQLSFRCGAEEFAFMSALDPAYREEHAGIAVLFHSIGVAIDEGMQQFNMLRGDEDYKDRLPNRDRPMRHFALAGSALGSLTLTGWQAAQRVAPLAGRVAKRLAALRPRRGSDGAVSGDTV